MLESDKEEEEGSWEQARAATARGSKGGGACLLIRKHDHFTPTREIRRHVRALARDHPKGWKLQESALSVPRTLCCPRRVLECNLQQNENSEELGLSVAMVWKQGLNPLSPKLFRVEHLLLLYSRYRS